MLLNSRLWITIEFELSSPSWSAPAPGPLSHGSTSWWMISLEVQKRRGMSQDFRGNHRKTMGKTWEHGVFTWENHMKTLISLRNMQILRYQKPWFGTTLLEYGTSWLLGFNYYTYLRPEIRLSCFVMCEKNEAATFSISDSPIILW